MVLFNSKKDIHYQILYTTFKFLTRIYLLLTFLNQQNEKNSTATSCNPDAPLNKKTIVKFLSLLIIVIHNLQ